MLDFLYRIFSRFIFSAFFWQYDVILVFDLIWFDIRFVAKKRNRSISKSVHVTDDLCDTELLPCNLSFRFMIIEQFLILGRILYIVNYPVLLSCDKVSWASLANDKLGICFCWSLLISDPSWLNGIFLSSIAFLFHSVYNIKIEICERNEFS